MAVCIQFIDYERDKLSPMLGPYHNVTLTYNFIRVATPETPLKEIGWFNKNFDKWYWNGEYWSDMCISSQKGE